MRKVTIRTRNVGCHFGTVGEVYDARGNQLLHTTAVVPYGFTGAARARAESHAESQGWCVFEPARDCACRRAS